MEQWKEAVLTVKGIKVISRQAGFREVFPGGRKGGSCDIALGRATRVRGKEKWGVGVIGSSGRERGAGNGAGQRTWI